MNIINEMSNQKKIDTHKENEIIMLVEKKIIFFNDIIQKTLMNIQKNKILGILGINDINTS
jgi:hypothetical protein